MINQDENMKIMVSVCCTAYNQENYIADALESILMQKIDFNIEILVHDDASTDMTSEIIKKYYKMYPNIIKPIYQVENQYSKGNEIWFSYNFIRATGKYIALCEGDDYWTDPYKLQKQVDYMENNPKCSLYVHAAEKVSHNKKHLGFIRPNNGDIVYTTTDVILGDGGMFATNSMFFPTKLVNSVTSFFLDCPVGDYPLVIYLSLYGEVYYKDTIMSAYRFMAMNSWSARVHGNYKKNIETYKSIIKMLSQVDLYSEHIHTKIFKKKIRQYKVKIIIKRYFPYVAKILEDIKKGINQ